LPEASRNPKLLKKIPSQSQKKILKGTEESQEATPEKSTQGRTARIIKLPELIPEEPEPEEEVELPPVVSRLVTLPSEEEAKATAQEKGQTGGS